MSRGAAGVHCVLNVSGGGGGGGCRGSTVYLMFQGGLHGVHCVLIVSRGAAGATV